MSEPLGNAGPAPSGAAALGLDATAYAVAEAASALLDMPIGLDTDLFDLGASSITVILLVGRLSPVLGKGFTPAVVMRGRTAREIAAAAVAVGSPVPTAVGSPTPVACPPAPAVAAGEPPAPRRNAFAARSPRWVTGLPITQYRMWYLERQYPGAGDHANAVLFRLRGQLRVDALGRAVRYVVQRHEALRTLLPSPDGKYVHPRVLPADDVDVPLELAEVREDELDAALDAFLWRPFDLGRDLPLRARLLRLDGTDHMLALSVHHAAYDGWSDGVLARDLSAAYTALVTGRRPDLPPALGFHAAARIQSDRAEAAGTDDDFWVEHLRGVPDLPLGAVPQGATGTVREVPVALDGVDPRLVRGACARFRTTPSAVYLAAWILALREETGGRDFSIGMPLAGRTVAEAENVIGCFASSAILRFPSTVDDGTGCLRYGAALLERAMTDQFMPLERIVFELPREDTGRNPFCQVGFVLQNNQHDTLLLPDVKAERVRVPQRDSIFEMALVLWPDSQFGSYIWYRDDVVPAERAQRLAGLWVKHVAELGRAAGRADDPEGAHHDAS